MNSLSNKERLLSMVRGEDPTISHRPILYDLRKYGGVHIMVSRRIYSDSELSSIARKDKEEHEQREREFREKHSYLLSNGN